MNIKYDRKIGQQIKALRIKRGWSQEQLAVKLQVAGCDLTRSAIAKIEVGQRYIYLDELKCLKEILAVQYDDLLL